MSLKDSCRLWNERLGPKPLIKVFLWFTKDPALYSDGPALPEDTLCTVHSSRGSPAGWEISAQRLYYYYYYITIVSAYWRWVYYKCWILRNFWNIPMGFKAIYLSKIDRSAKWIHPSPWRNHNHHHLASRTYFHRLYKLRVGRDRSVGIATRYWLDGPGIESCWGRDLLHLSRPVLGPTQPPVQWVT